MYKVHVRRTIVFSILGLAVGLVIAWLSREIYEARVELLLGSTVGSRNPNIVFDDEIAKILARNEPQGVMTERQLLNSETVYFQALNEAAPDLVPDWEDYYLMYDVVTARTPNQNEQGAGIAQVRVRTYDRETSIRVANEVTAAYNETREKAEKDSTVAAINYLMAQVESTERALLEAETAYQSYKEEIQVADLARKMMDETDHRGELDQALTSNRAELRGLDDAVAKINELIGTVEPTVPDYSSSGRNPIIGMIEGQITEFKMQRSVLLSQYTEENPKVKVVNEAIEDAERRLAEAKSDPTVHATDTERKNPILSDLQAQLAGSKARRAEILGRMDSLQTSLDKQDLKLAATPEMEMTITRLQRDRFIFDDKYRRLKTQLEELENRRETGRLYAVPLGERGATASEDPVAPEPVKFAFIGFIAGACIGLVMSFTLESLRPRVYTSMQLANLTGLPVVATVPALAGLSRSKAVENLAQHKAAPLESFRNMAYSFLASSASEGRTVLFTGIGAAGSSSISAAQFAVALAQAGTRVVLVDAERTRQIISTGFGVTDKKGVSNAFYDGSDPTTMLVETKYKNLTVLPLGTVPETLVTNGGPDQVESLLASLRQVSDMIVISVAPTDIVADAAAFASRVDEVCLSVSARSNEYGSVPTAYDILDKAGAKAIKLILTDASKGGEPFTSPTSIQRAV